MEPCKRPHPSPRVSVVKTVSVLLIEISSLSLPVPLMICMGSQYPEHSHLLGSGRFKFETKLSIYFYRTHRLRGARRDHTQVAIDKPVSVFLIEASYSHHFEPVMICMGSPCPEPSYLLFRNNMKMRPYLIFTLTGPIGLRGARRFRDQVAADKPVSGLLLETSLCATIYPRNEMDVLSTRPIKLRGCGDPQRGLI